MTAPPRLAPMLATSGPFPGDDANWLYEVKWDGWRAHVTVDGAVRVHTRRGRDATASFPELAGMADALSGRRVVLDGELVASKGGTLDFWAVGGRRGGSGGRGAAEPVSVAFLAFDVLWVDGEQITRRPLRDRKAILAELELSGPAWREAPWQIGDGSGLFAACDELGLEGIVAKRLDSMYRPGVRSTLWRKRKCRAWLEEQAPRRLPREVRARMLSARGGAGADR